MRKIISIIMMVVIFASVFAMPTFAQTTDSDYLYRDKFIDYISPFELGMYDECYYHTDENGDIDWVLMNTIVLPISPMPISIFVCDMFIESTQRYYSFGTGYGIYDVNADQFYDLASVNPSDYDDFDIVIKTNINGRPLGDADFDNELTILDATQIQFVLAKLDHFIENGITRGDSVSDFDRDGRVSILDATAIQKKLAQVE